MHREPAHMVDRVPTATSIIDEATWLHISRDALEMIDDALQRERDAIARRWRRHYQDLDVVPPPVAELQAIVGNRPAVEHLARRAVLTAVGACVHAAQLHSRRATITKASIVTDGAFETTALATLRRLLPKPSVRLIEQLARSLCHSVASTSAGAPRVGLAYLRAEDGDTVVADIEPQPEPAEAVPIWPLTNSDTQAR